MDVVIQAYLQGLPLPDEFRVQDNWIYHISNQVWVAGVAEGRLHFAVGGISDVLPDISGSEFYVLGIKCAEGHSYPVAMFTSWT